MKNVLVVTDNVYLLEKLKNLVDSNNFEAIFKFRNSPGKVDGSLMAVYELSPINLKEEWQQVVQDYDLVISIHCKQIFPAEMTRLVKCINVHPGLNPYNRGWYPQVFGIINNLPWGVTIHEIDEKLDHGDIIIQEQMDLHAWDTSSSAYIRALDKEIELLKKVLNKIIDGNYSTTKMPSEGNVNIKKDFKDLCALDLNEKVTMKEAINRLRAMSFEGYKNAFYIDDLGNKIFIRVELEKE
ncbi:dTDP-4-amino-4,6-dideoxyglucose formyltransferase [Gammaproteobacteria bacterium]|nr:dTDP-4-amino-4,6-dideoxyglucose formyltransferase [Gammaproteobacteria bacterium]